MLKPAEGKKKIGVVDFQKRKAGAKCIEPGVTITCPNNCFGCDRTSIGQSNFGTGELRHKNFGTNFEKFH